MAPAKSKVFEFKYDNSEEEKKLLQPLSYLTAKPGHGHSKNIIKVFNSFFQIPDEEFTAFKELFDPFLACSLLVDDIADGSQLRRGNSCSYLEYGVQLTRRTTTFTLFLTFKNTLNLDNPKITEHTIRKVVDTGKGQGIEIYWRDNFICPTEEEYKKMAGKKTGSFFAIVFNLMNCMGQVKYDYDFSNISRLFGIYYQIRDDIRNLISADYTKDKGFCEDISEGKFSFPVIHAINTRPEDKRILNILKQKPKDEETKKYCLSLLQEFGSIDYASEVLLNIKTELIDELKKLPNTIDLINVVEEVYSSELTVL